MVNHSYILLPFQKIFVLALLFGAITASSTFAQGEDRNRNMPEHRVDDNFGAMESPESPIIIESNTKPTGNVSKEKSLNTGSVKNNNIYKQAGEKDVRKENVSTLSFNLFLYIVDKFKED
jgi:hypothetical protein